MIKMSINSTAFKKDMQNIVNYSFGFLEGVQKGKPAFFRNLGANVKEILENYIDSNARINPEALHHVYEWYQTGSANARLFDVQYSINNNGISFITQFKQSTTIKSGSNVPFYDKARIMEDGIPVIIKPRQSDVLVFEQSDGTVFTKASINVADPGGTQVQGSFEKVINTFFRAYFTQSFMRSSGISDYFKNPIVYKKNFSAGKRSGRSKGIETGYRWIANAGVIING